MALQADAWHLRTDVYTSLGVMFGLLVIWIAGLIRPDLDLRWIDPVVAIAVALLILKAAWDLGREIGAGPPRCEPAGEGRGLDQELRLEHLAAGAQLPHNLRTRKAGPYRFIDFHLVVDDQMSVAQAHALGDSVVGAIRERLAESRVDVHMEPCDHTCKASCAEGCSVDIEARGRPEGEEGRA